MVLMLHSILGSYIILQGELSPLSQNLNMAEHDKLYIPSDFGIMIWMSTTNGSCLWKNRLGLATPVDNNNFHSINGVLRNSDMIAVSLESECYRSYESGLIDLPNVHNVYLHCINLGHFNSIGVRGENTMIKQVPVSSSFGHLIIDSVCGTS